MRTNLRKLGFVPIDRSIFDEPFFKKSKDVHLWLYLMGRAAHSSYNVDFNGTMITLQPGQLTCGRKEIALATGIAEGTVQGILNRLERQHVIKQQTSNKCRLITMLHWIQSPKNRQQNEHQVEQQLNNQQTLKKNDNNVNTPPKSPHGGGGENEFDLGAVAYAKLVKWFKEMDDVANPEALAKTYVERNDPKHILRALKDQNCISRDKFAGLLEQYKNPPPKR